MKERPVLRVAGRQTECVSCRLAAYRHKPLRDKRAIFFHLLWHRDEGDDVPIALLNAYDDDVPDGTEDIPIKDIGRFVGTGGGYSEFSQGTYGHDVHGRPIYPARRGRLMPMHDRGGRSVRQRSGGGAT